MTNSKGVMFKHQESCLRRHREEGIVEGDAIFWKYQFEMGTNKGGNMGEDHQANKQSHERE